MRKKGEEDGMYVKKDGNNNSLTLGETLDSKRDGKEEADLRRTIPQILPAHRMAA